LSVDVRAATPADHAAVADLVEAAFGRDAEAVLVDELRDEGYARIELVAVSGDDVVGHVLLSELVLDGGAGLVLGPLAVAPSTQRRGVGTALVRAALDRARADGWPVVVLLGDPAYYGRFGFRPARDLDITGPYGDGDAFMALPLGAPVPAGFARHPEPFTRLP
jgi:putative acetyltransferase